MSWGLLGPVTFRVGKNGGTVTVFAAWFVILPLASWWLSSPLAPSRIEESERVDSDDR